MKLFGIIFALIIQLLATHTVAIPTVPIVSAYATLSKLCNEGAEDTYAAVLYANGIRKTYKYDECYPYSIDKSKAVQVVFCKPAFCVGKSEIDCTGTTFPPEGVYVPVPPGTTLINPLGFVRVTGEAALCSKPQNKLR